MILLKREKKDDVLSEVDGVVQWVLSIAWAVREGMFIQLSSRDQLGCCQQAGSGRYVLLMNVRGGSSLTTYI